MIPDFPTEKAKLQEFWNDYLVSKHREYLGYFAGIPSYRHHEGHEWTISNEGHAASVSAYQEIKAEFGVKFDEVPNLTIEQIRQRIDSVAQDLARQMVQRILSDIHEAVTESGNMIDAGGRKLSKELFLELFERMELGFDEDGNPNLPALLVHPNLWEKIQDDVKAWGADPEFRQKKEWIIERKREVWRDRESNRKLVD